MKIFIILCLTLFIFSACSSKKRVVLSVKELPIWYTNPSKSTVQTLYSIADGENKEEAIANALTAMASTLSVFISSDFNNKTIVKSGTIESYQSISSNQVTSEVKKIRIANYEIINAEKFSFNKYLVEIKSDKQKLFNSLDKELNQKFKIIKNRIIDAQNYNAFKRLGVYKEAKESTANLEYTLLTMSSLNPSFNSTEYIEKLQKIESNYEQLFHTVSFSIKSNLDAKNLKSVIANGLSLKKYKIKTATSNNHFNIYLYSDTKYVKSYGFDLARSAISITVKDLKGNIIGSNKLNITGYSTQGHTISKEDIAVKLNDMLKKNGISNIIGLEI